MTPSAHLTSQIITFEEIKKIRRNEQFRKPYSPRR